LSSFTLAFFVCGWDGPFSSVARDEDGDADGSRFRLLCCCCCCEDMMLVVSLAVANLSCFVICCFVWLSCDCDCDDDGDGLRSDECCENFQIETVEPFFNPSVDKRKRGGRLDMKGCELIFED
jgi:hypothetical protein